MLFPSFLSFSFHSAKQKILQKSLAALSRSINTNLHDKFFCAQWIFIDMCSLARSCLPTNQPTNPRTKQRPKTNRPTHHPTNRHIITKYPQKWFYYKFESPHYGAPLRNYRLCRLLPLTLLRPRIRISCGWHYIVDLHCCCCCSGWCPQWTKTMTIIRSSWWR